MPYIAKSRAQFLDPVIDRLIADIQTEGELNYAISRLAAGRLWKIGKSYANLSRIRAVLHDASAEFYHRLMRPYEDAREADDNNVKEYEVFGSR